MVSYCQADSRTLVRECSTDWQRRVCRQDVDRNDDTEWVSRQERLGVAEKVVDSGVPPADRATLQDDLQSIMKVGFGKENRALILTPDDVTFIIRNYPYPDGSHVQHL